MEFTFCPVTRERWGDFEKLFESRGSPHFCWCTVWREVEKRGDKPDKGEKKASMRKRVDEGVPIGILGYSAGEPVAWCSVAPRETYRSLGGDETKEDVWSLTCFFVCRRFRNRGITRLLIREAKEYAKRNGAQYLEAYPVEKNSPSYRFMGYLKNFEEAGFDFVKEAGTRRKVMIYRLKQDR